MSLNQSEKASTSNQKTPVETPDVTILIPAYNEGDALGGALEALKPYADYYREVLVVDDGSTDNTAAVAKAHGARVISHPVNRGYGAALKTGTDAAQTNYVLMFDADGQHPADQIPAFVEGLGEYDLVLGMRVRGSDAAMIRKPGKFILAIVANRLAGQKIPDLNCGMRLVHCDVLRRYRSILPEGFSLSTTTTIASLKDRLRVRWIPIKSTAREGRPSSVRIVRDGLATLMLILRVIMLFDPLKIFLPASGFLGLLGLAMLLVEWALSHTLELTEASLFCFLSMILVFLFGLVADQISFLRRQLR